jgi:hypothetical protein
LADCLTPFVAWEYSFAGRNCHSLALGQTTDIRHSSKIQIRSRGSEQASGALLLCAASAQFNPQAARWIMRHLPATLRGSGMLRSGQKRVLPVLRSLYFLIAATSAASIGRDIDPTLEVSYMSPALPNQLHIACSSVLHSSTEFTFSAFLAISTCRFPFAETMSRLTSLRSTAFLTGSQLLAVVLSPRPRSVGMLSF